MSIHKSSIEMLRRHSAVLIMDSTYRTNRFRLPLFNIVGIPPMELYSWQFLS
ncbi:hypothetical protein V1507DRAFT_465970 [Lipomyces tetrasporus]